MNPIATAVLVALGLSLAGNAGLSYLLLDARDRATAAESSRDQWKGSAETCSASVDELQKQAARRLKESAAATEAARVKALEGFKAADRILSTPASTPGDDCKSAQDRAAEWLKGRARP